MGRKDKQLILDIKELFLEKAIGDNVLTQGGVPPKPDGREIMVWVGNVYVLQNSKAPCRVGWACGNMGDTKMTGSSEATVLEMQYLRDNFKGKTKQ